MGAVATRCFDPLPRNSDTRHVRLPVSTVGIPLVPTERRPRPISCPSNQSTHVDIRTQMHASRLSGMRKDETNTRNPRESVVVICGEGGIWGLEPGMGPGRSLGGTGTVPGRRRDRAGTEAGRNRDGAGTVPGPSKTNTQTKTLSCIDLEGRGALTRT